MNNMFPRFFIKQLQNSALTIIEGRPIFKAVEYVEIRIAGDSNNVPVMKVNDDHRARWEAQYKAFKAGKDYQGDGMPIKEWNGVSATKAAELVGIGVFTVEALANLPDSYLHKIGIGARELIITAKDYINGVDDQSKKIEELNEQLTLMEGKLLSKNKKYIELSAASAKMNDCIAHTSKIKPPKGCSPAIKELFDMAKIIRESIEI